MTDPAECPVGDPAACPVPRERRVDDHRWAVMEARMDTFEGALRANTELTRQVKANTDNIVTLFESGRAFFRVMGMVGGFAKWLTKVAAGMAILWVIFRYGVMEAILDLGGNGKP